MDMKKYLKTIIITQVHRILFLKVSSLLLLLNQRISILKILFEKTNSKNLKGLLEVFNRKLNQFC